MERGSKKRDLQVLEVRRWRELVADRKKMEGHCSTSQSPQWAVVPMEEDDAVKLSLTLRTYVILLSKTLCC
jgi:hypothetical protein